MMGMLCASLAHAQMQEVVVTANRVNGEDYSRMPAVTITKQADFLVRSVRLNNDTRSDAARTEELYQTIKDLLGAAAKQSGFGLAYGEDFLIPITAADYKIPLNPEGKRPDASYVDIYIKIALGSQANVSEVITKLNGFIKNAKLTGRTEIKPQDDLALSLVNPERFRYEIIQKISQDATQLRAAVSKGCKVGIEGLENRVMWQRSDISELTLYIPHRVQLTDCE
jgi:hypothetical protein